MRDPFANYDSWLERPFQQAAEEADRFIQFCEDHDLNLDDPDSEVIYNDYIDSQWEEPDYDYEREEDEY